MGLQIPFNLPAGSITQYAGNTAPQGWLLMYGQAISRVTYKSLFDAIGTTYGAGDGFTTFNIPDARGRVLFGKDDMGGSAANRLTSGGGGVNGAALGSVGGNETVTLTTMQIPNHAHTLTVRTSAISPGGTTKAQGSDSSGDSLTHTLAASGGGGSSHNNIPPALVINYIIKT